MLHLPWARKFARVCSSKLPSHLDRADLQGAGILGYLRAAARYDVARGTSFKGYCAVRIRGAVLDEVRRWDWAPRSVYENNRRITRITTDLAECLDREPTPQELAAALGLDAAELATFEASWKRRQIISFDEVIENGHGDLSVPLRDRLADPNMARPDICVQWDEDRRALVQCIGRLSKTQGTVIVLHYLQGVPLRDVARLLAVTPSRVSQVHHQALGRLKLLWRAAMCAA